MRPVCGLSLEPRAMMLPSRMAAASSIRARMRSSTVASFAAMIAIPPSPVLLGLGGSKRGHPVKTQDAQRITSQFDSNESPVVTAAASHLFLAFRPVASSLAASVLAAPAPRAARVVAAAQAALLQEERCAGAAPARSAEESVAAEQAHSDWAPAEDSAGPSADGSLLAAWSVVRSADGTFPAQGLAAPSADDSLPDGWAPVDCSAVRSADGSLPAACSAAWG